MSVPVVLSILLSLQSALQGIAQASGYHYTLKATSVVLDPTELATVNPDDVPFIVIADSTLRNEGGTSRNVSIKSYLDVTVTCRVDAPLADRDAKTTAAWNLYADIEKALLVDPQRGGVAMFTYPDYNAQTKFFWGLAPQGQVYLEIPVRVLFQRVYGVA